MPKLKLIVTEEGKQREYDVATLTTIGRHPDNTVELRDDLVSKFHCQLIVVDAGRCVLRDCGSLNGTVVSGQRITEFVLAGDAEFTVGRAEFKLVGLGVRARPAVSAPPTFSLPPILPHGEPADAATTVRRLEESFVKLQIRCNEMASLVALVANRSGSLEEGSQRAGVQARRLDEAVARQELGLAEVRAQCYQLCDQMTAQEHRIAALAEEQDQIKRQMAALMAQKPAPLRAPMTTLGPTLTALDDGQNEVDTDQHPIVRAAGSTSG